MKQYSAENIRNIALAGHSGSGKTSLSEALLLKSGTSQRAESPAATLASSLASFEYNDIKVNLLDTPGLFDFAGGMYEAVSAADTVMITVSAKSGVKVGTEKAYDLAGELGKPKMFVITKVDDPDANYFNVLTELKTKFGPTVCPVVFPIIKDHQVVSFVNLIEMKAYTYDSNGNAVETEMPTAEVCEKLEYRMDGLVAAFSEAVAETDDSLMEKFFEGEAFTQKELVHGIHKGMNEGIITPVVCCSSTTTAGVDMILKEISLLLPSPADNKPVLSETAAGNIVEIKYSDSEPTAAYVFKTVADPFVGKMSFLKILGGKITANTDYVNSSTAAPEKLGKLYTFAGKKQTEITEALAGDIAVAVKIGANTGDTICASSRVVNVASPDFPKPCYGMAVRAKTQGDEAKVSSGIARLIEEDKTLSFGLDPFTKEQILKGLGEQHLENAVAKLKNKFGAEVVLAEPKIAYRETIRKKVKAEGKYKKQTGGHGQYGHVWIEFEPCISDGLVFEEKVVGGAVPKNFFPAVEKGLQDCVKKGVLAGCPVMGLKAILVDGSYHPVDSSEMSFKTAASLAYKEGLKQADPTILEPIGKLYVTAADENTGDIMGDLNKRRGRVIGMTPVKNGMTEIEAEVPLREMQSFTMQLRQITRGKGSFSLEFLRYEQLPGNLVSEVILSMGGTAEE
ncbi:MAG: elongation factor G [Oscillospiraceae bacterium]